MKDLTQIDTLWLLACSLVVLFMQVGFLALECGLTRPKNSINVAVKNLTDLTLTFLVFSLISYQLMFGETFLGLFGTEAIITEDKIGFTNSFFIFQAVFCSSTITILSGAIAERVRFSSYIVLVLFISLVIYPIFGHWVFAGIINPENKGWLESLGFMDFAGASSVHLVGGMMSLITCIFIGARKHRFTEDGTNSFNGSNIPLSVIGTLFLMVGWFGFNAGSVYKFDGLKVSHIFINTFAGASVGLISTLALGYYLSGKARVTHIITGLLGGLVFTTASADKMTFIETIVLSLPVAPIIIYGRSILKWFRIDDTVDAIPVHLFCGIWGLIAVSLTSSVDGVLFSQVRIDALSIQLLGILVCISWCLITLYPALIILNKIKKIRISEEEEEVGLNIAEHGTSTEISDFLKSVSHLQSEDDYFDIDIPQNQYTEVGQIGALFNELLDKVKDISEQRTKVAYKSGVAENAIEVLHSIGNTITPMAIKVNDLKDMNDLKFTGELLSKIVNTLEVKLKEESLMDFMQNDEKGKTLIPILQKIVQQVSDIQGTITKNGHEIGKKIENISQIITLQQQYANTDMVDRKTVRVSKSIKDAHNMIQELITKNQIAFDVKKHEKELLVVCSSNKLMQVLMNFYKNSIESINEQRKHSLISGQIKTTIEKKEDNVIINITDNGRGFDEETKKNLFNFGFSTKERGSGFGLHDCYNFAKSNNGNIDINSEGLSHGCTITLTLPLKESTELKAVV